MRGGLLCCIAFAALAIPAMAGEEDVTLASMPAALHGTLSRSVQGGPAVLMIAGSGPTDRDGNSPQGLNSNSYKLLAAGLAAKGITSLRVDKRGIAASRPAMTAESDLRFQTYVEDAQAWTQELRKQSGVSCVWLLGHSEGALVAELAAQNRSDICGLVLLAGSGRKAGDLLRDQLQSAPEAIRRPALAALSELEAGHAVPNPPAQPAGLFRTSVQPYLISWLPLDPPALLKKTKVPVLIVQGDNDLQVSVADARALAAARPDARLIVLNGVNHLLKSAPADRAGNIATYGDPSLPLAPGVVDAVANFMLGQVP